MNTLANELLALILSASFLVLEEHFADNSDKSPFAEVMQSSADLQLVCKRWMRVTTPLLYECVVLRTRAQAYALKLALTRHPEFGRFTRRLHLEGVFGEYLDPPVFETMPAVKQFSLNFSFSSYTNITGLQRAFELFNLERVVLNLCGPYYYSQRHHLRTQLAQDLAEAISSWSGLRHFTFAHCYGHAADLLVETTILPALLTAPNLRTVTGCFVVVIETSQLFSRYYEPLLHKASLEHLILQGPSASWIAASYTSRPEPLRSNLVPFINAHGRIGEPGLVTDAFIHARGARYYLDDDYQAWWKRLSSITSSFDTDIDNSTIGACYSVSRDFNMATKRVLARSLVLQSPSNLPVGTTQETFASDHQLPMVVRRLELRCSSGRWASLYPTASDLDDDEPLARMTGLEDLIISSSGTNDQHVINLVWPVFQQSSGRNLVRLAITLFTYSGPVGDIFAGLDSLEDLYWCGSSWSLDNDDNPYGINATDNRLPRLRSLVIDNAHPGLYNALARFSLPLLQAINFQQPHYNLCVSESLNLLDAHGGKIVQAELYPGLVTQPILDRMSNISILRLPGSVKPKCIIGLRHERLSSIHVQWYLYVCGSQYSDARYRFRDHKSFIGHLRKGVGKGFWPSLREVQIQPDPTGRIAVWPLTESETKRSPWPALVKALGEVGVTIVDSNGFPFRERRTYAPRKKRKQPIERRALPMRGSRVRDAARHSGSTAPVKS